MELVSIRFLVFKENEVAKVGVKELLITIGLRFPFIEGRRMLKFGDGRS